MDGIARTLQVAKPTLYRMAASREELIGACIDAEAERLLEQIHSGFGPPQGPPADPLAEVFRALFRFVDDSPAGFALLFGGRYPQARQAVRRVENRLREIQRREARAAGRELAQPGLVAAGLLALAAGVAMRAMEDGEGCDSAELLAALAGALAGAHTEA